MVLFFFQIIFQESGKFDLADRVFKNIIEELSPAIDLSLPSPLSKATGLSFSTVNCVIVFWYFHLCIYLILRKLNMHLQLLKFQLAY